ncbi:uncharacterized protein LOC122499811 [Leptopilina heterotoma]|uniref:uncharacterized protein LOC122499811 n=1 Tax=Leptopilina heterotoma TaxID=63436 RepID=UPI001CA8B8C8|nr:uncharacterized protein LOC122499811 [Leptopilina heterotoma]
MFLLKTMFKVIFSLVITQAFCNNYIALKQINRGNLKAPSDIIFNRSRIFDPKESYKKEENFQNNSSLLKNKEDFTKSGLGKRSTLSSRTEEDTKFVPTKIYTQVRASHVIERVPRQEAINEDASEESKENAANLKEVITNKKISTVYTEEGYEDAAYDHGGRLRDANYNEEYAKKFYNHNVKKAANPHPNSADEDNFHTYGKYPKTFKIVPNSVNKREKTNKKDRQTDKHFRKFLKSRTYPKLVVDQGIKQLERDVENNYSYEPSKVSHLQYADDSDNVKEGQQLKPDIRHISKKKSRKRLNNDAKKSKRNYTTLERNKYNKNDLVLNISPNTSKVVETVKKFDIKPNSTINSNYYTGTTLRSIVNELPSTPNYSNIYDNFFKKEGVKSTKLQNLKELGDKTSIKPDPLLSENVKLLTKQESDHLKNISANKSRNIPFEHKGHKHFTINSMPRYRKSSNIAKTKKYPLKNNSNFKINYNDSLSNTAVILPVFQQYFQSTEGINPSDFLSTISSDEPFFNTLHFYPIQNKYLIRKKRSRRREYEHRKIERSFNKPSIRVNNKQKYPFSRIVTNEVSIPKKTFGGMEFYESRKSLCNEVNPYVKELDSLNKNSSRNQELSTKSSRLPGLQTQFECLKEKYFDNLNNPLFSMSQMEQPILPHVLHKMKLMSKKLRS